jgi:anhydro-N-acetylmuramic acid kinase
MTTTNIRIRPTRVLGLMSGTSADGIDVALVEISGAPPDIRAKLTHFHSVPHSDAVREEILRVAAGKPLPPGEISQLNFLLGDHFGRAALAACKKFGVPIGKIDLIGSHGQTVYHQGAASKFLSAHVSSTLQIGEPALIAQLTGVTTVADFRPADIAAGGQGAPLVPYVDYLLYRDARRGRVALNIGGIGNVSVIPAGAKPSDVWAFDTGPGNMLIDGLVRHFSHGLLHFDADAKSALRGKTIHALLDRGLENFYLRQQPPKSAGREQFGEEYLQEWISWKGRRKFRSEDFIRTATILTASSIAEAFHRFIFPKAEVQDLIVSGGGARNPLLMAELKASLPRLEFLSPKTFGVPGEAKEAFAFAVLAYESFHHRPGNLPSATGADQPAILGKIVYAPPR